MSAQARATHAGTRITRRRLIRLGAGAAAGAAVAGPLSGCFGDSDEARSERVVVIGAGLAGLACAYRLHQRGIEAAVFEARPDRLGGRCWTARDFTEGQVAEHGGEFIDTAHARIRALAEELGLELEDRDAYAARAPRSHGRRIFGGELISPGELYEGWGTFMSRLRRVGARTGYPRTDTPAARAVDRRDALALVEELVPGGAETLLGQALRAYLGSEFGLDASELAATSLLYLLEGNASDEDGSDERFHIAGGNDQLVSGMADNLADGAVTMDAPLESLWRRDGGTYGLEIAGVGELTAERVVLALPFTTLRDVDLDDAGLSPLKREAIDELGMGTNSKVLLQFERRPQHYGRWNGNLTTDTPFEYTWDTSVTQAGRAGLITAYSGGANGTAYDFPAAHGPAPETVVDSTLAALEPAAPGITEGFNGRAFLDEWASDPWARGSYAAFEPGQTSRYSRRIREPEGGIHFAGEHTSIGFQGFLEGAVESGERAAREVQRSL